VQLVTFSQSSHISRQHLSVTFLNPVGQSSKHCFICNNLLISQVKQSLSELSEQVLQVTSHPLHKEDDVSK